MSSCGCSGNQGTPPGSTPKATSLPSEAGNSYGGNTVIPNSCAPSVCPQPPVNNEVGRDPYCPDWIQKVLSAIGGKILLIKGTCLHYLRSKCTGVVWYDASTEEVTVKDAPFVSSIPKQTTYGHLAKVVSGRKQICDDASEECKQEAVQELAAQIMADAQLGDLVIAQTPLCGELPLDESADADKQVAFHRLSPTDIECPANVGFLVAVDSTRGSGPNKLATKKWHWLKSMKLRRSQWKQAISGSTDEASSFIAVMVPVAGGVTNDPCYELRISEVKPGSGIPSTADNCDGLVFLNKGTPEAGWYAKPKGLSFHPITRPGSNLFESANAGSFQRTLPDFPSKPCGPVWVQFEVEGQAFPGPSASATTIALFVGSYLLGRFTTEGGVQGHQGMMPAAADGTITFTVTQTGSGIRYVSTIPIGYWY